MSDNKPGNNDNNNNNNNKKPGGISPKLIILAIAIILTLIFWERYTAFKQSGEKEVPYSQFIEMVEQNQVKEVEIYGSKIYFTPNESEDYLRSVKYFVVRTDDYSLVDRLANKGVEFKEIDEGMSVMLKSVISNLIIIVVLYLFLMMIMKGITKDGGIMNFNKSNSRMYMEKKTGITFKDVAGEEEAKESLVEVVDFLHNPEKYIEIGAKLPRGALLVGPPGTGKTLLAKAVAGEANVPFFSMAGSDFVEMYVGVGASRVRELFKQASSKAPCIIFIDEIDAIGRSRDSRNSGGDSEREQTLNQLLSEMDGFDTSKGIVVLAATNRPEVLDKALLRPGRFDRRVIVEKPDLKGREDILKVHAKNVKQDETVDMHEMALATAGAVGADLANIVNEAAILAVKNKRKFVSQKDLMESVEVVFAGKEKKDRLLSQKEKEMVAYHEVGHALLVALQKNTEPVQRITIIPRTMGSLGYVWQVPEEEKYLVTQAEMEADIVTFLGGRAAEAIKFDSVTTGASNDIEQATKKARSMVTLYGMSDKFGMVQLEGISGKYLDGSTYLQCSDETATKIDKEVRDIIKRSYDKAYKLLKRNEPILDEIAKFLIEKETITGKEFMEIFERVSKNMKGYREKEEIKTVKEKSSEKTTYRVFKSYDDKDSYKHPDQDASASTDDPEATVILKKDDADSKELKVEKGAKEAKETKDADMVMPWEAFAKAEKEKVALDEGESDSKVDATDGEGESES